MEFRTLVDSLVEQDIPAGATPIAVVIQISEITPLHELWDFGRDTLFHNRRSYYQEGKQWTDKGPYRNDWRAD